MNRILFLILAGCSLALLSSISAFADDVPANIKAVMTPYLKIHDALAKDSMDGIADAAKEISTAAAADKTMPGKLVAQADSLAGAKDLVAARAAFVAISKTLIHVLMDAHVTAYFQAYCPMVKQSWLQSDKTVSNPFSADMGTCGDLVDLGSHL